MLIVYKALVRSRIEYGSVIWSSLPKYLLSKLEVIQLKALRLSLGLPNSCPNNVVLAEAGESILQSRLKYLSNNYVSRVLSDRNHLLIPLLEELEEKAESSSYFPKYLNSPVVSAYKLINKLESEFYSFSIHKSAEYPPEIIYQSPNISLEEGYKIEEAFWPNLMFMDTFVKNPCTEWYFTDGSRKADEENTGFAVVDFNNTITYKYKASRYASIFSCEAMVILSALELVSKATNVNASIFSDSQSVLQSLLNASKGLKRSYLILEILKLYNDLSKDGYNINLYWIPAHKGVDGNEMADRAAKEASHTGECSPWLPPASDFRTKWKAEMKESSIKFIKSEGLVKGIRYCNLNSDINLVPWFTKIKPKLSRRIIVSISRLRTGHSALRIVYIDLIWSILICVLVTNMYKQRTMFFFNVKIMQLLRRSYVRNLCTWVISLLTGLTNYYLRLIIMLLRLFLIL